MSAFCYIERVPPDRMIRGWAQIQGRHPPCVIKILLHGETVAKARANLFRRDLFVTGLGHGHYGFEVPAMKPIPAGDLVFDILDAETSEPFHNSPSRMTAFEAKPRPPFDPRRLMTGSQRWTDADIKAAPGCLQLERNMERLGPKRFLDVVCQFLLNTWPTAAETEQVAKALETKAITPLAFFLNLIEQTAKPDRPRLLPSPYDPPLANRFVLSQS